MSSSDAGDLTADERSDLLERYEGLRVTDVVDGLDYNGYYDLQQMDREIRPLHRDPESFSHRMVGFAHTVRFHPTNRPRPGPMDSEEFDEWKGEWYSDVAPGPFTDDIRENDVIVIEAHGSDVGYIGSNNSLSWVTAGAVGVVTNGGARDTDEIVKQGIPTYTKHVNKTIRPGRLELDDVQVPISVGGVKVRPEDVIVADGDGVVAVPIEVATEVAEDARHVQRNDQATREELYEAAGLEKDFTLEDPTSEGE